jgi:hypothetical protein
MSMAGIKDLAGQIQGKGRGYDDHLVHMSGAELQGLQQLAAQHGGSLTINPQTGLYEAGFLGSILPMVAGAASEFFFPGNPWGAAAVGAGVGALTGDKKNGLLMNAGLGALGGWGGSSLAGSFMDAGLSSGAAASAAADMSPASGFVTPAENAAQFISPTSAPQMSTALDAVNEAGAIDPSASLVDVPNATTPKVSPYAKDLQVLQPMARGDQLLQGLKSASDAPMDFLKKNKNAAMGAGIAALGLYGSKSPQSGALGGQPGMSPYPKQNYSYTPQQWNGQGYSNPYYTQMAGGGIAHLASGGQPQDPRMIKGPGDGLSDDVPATIQGGKPAALADGEFVVSSDVVSALGGGSTDAGARKLYSMMDRVRKQAHGTKRQVKKVNERRALPA